MVKLWIGLGHVHPEGVLWLSNTKSGSKMMATMHLFTVAMVWHDEPIRLCIRPHTGTQVREYVALRGRCLSGTQAQIPGGEVVSQPSTSEPHPEGGPSHNSTWLSGTTMMPN